MSETHKQFGILFTNHEHKVIYVDSKLKYLLGDDSSWYETIIEKPIYQLFKMTADNYQKFVDVYIAGKSRDKLPMDIWISADKYVPTTLEATIKHNNQNTMMGIDYRVTLASQQTIPFNIQSVDNHLIQDLKNIYLKAQLASLYQVATDWGGDSLGKYLNHIINTTANEYNWQVTMQKGKVVIEGDLANDAYIALLAKAGAYMSATLGSKLVNKQIKSVNESTNKETFNHIKSNWYQLFNRL